MERIDIPCNTSRSDVIVLRESGERNWDITMGAQASLSLLFVVLPGVDDAVKCSISLSFAGEGGSCRISGLYIADGRSKVDVNVNLVHNLPCCSSRQMFKGILCGEARTRFYGLIKVPRECIGTEAYQENHNLLLGESCHAQSLPQLEIYADDVKCSHGATFSKIDTEALFYMRSRGIDLAQARRLLIIAFALDVLEGAPQDVVDEVLSRLENIALS